MYHQLYRCIYSLAIICISCSHTSITKHKFSMHHLSYLFRSDIVCFFAPTGQVKNLATEGFNVSIKCFFTVSPK